MKGSQNVLERIILVFSQVAVFPAADGAIKQFETPKNFLAFLPKYPTPAASYLRWLILRDCSLHASAFASLSVYLAAC